MTASALLLIDSPPLGSCTIATTALLEARDAIAFAAGIAAPGAAYYDDRRRGGPLVHPAIAFSMQWRSRFRLDLPPEQQTPPFGVHASTDLSILRPFAVGQSITTQGRLVARRQLPPGVLSIERYRMSDSAGRLLAELDFNVITRHATLAGGDAALEPERPLPAPAPAGAAPLWHDAVDIGPHASHQYTECARIDSPIHTSEKLAEELGLPGIILHGSATQAIALSQVIARHFDGDAARITRLCGQLRAPVRPGTTLTVEGLSVRESADTRIVAFQARNADGGLAIANGIVAGRLQDFQE